MYTRSLKLCAWKWKKLLSRIQLNMWRIKCRRLVLVSKSSIQMWCKICFLHLQWILLKGHQLLNCLKNNMLLFVTLRRRQKEGSLMEIVDLTLESSFNMKEAERMIKVALLCTNASPMVRLTMSEVVSMLEGQTRIQQVISDPSIYNKDL